MRKKVLLCIPSFATGGAERFVVDLALNLDKDKFDVSVAETRANVDSAFRNLINAAGIKIVDLSGKTYPEMLRKQFAYFRREKPDVVHANTGSVLHTMLLCFLFRIKNRIYTIHNEAKLLYGRSGFKKLVYKAAFSIFGFTPVAICPTVKETIIHEMQIKGDKIPVVNNGVNIENYKPETNNNQHQNIHVIAVGRLCRIKNQEMIVNAICNLHEKLGEQIELDIIGDGEERENLEKLISRRRANAYIHMHGMQSNVRSFLVKADVFVSGSQTEGLPLSILEAMACGLPVVATNAGGTKDIVDDGVNGYIVPIDNQEVFESVLEKMINNKELRRKFGYQSRIIAEQWSLSNCVKNYEILYEYR